MDRVARFNVLAMSGRAVEASGDVDVILLDKTGTITYGNRLAASITPAPGVAEVDAVRAALVSSIQDRRPRVARSSSSPGPGWPRSARPPATGDDAGFARLSNQIAEEIPFRAETRTSGVRTVDGAIDPQGRRRRHRRARLGGLPAEIVAGADRLADLGATPLVLESDGKRPRAHRAQGHGQGGPGRAVRGVPQDGHPDRR